MEIRKIIQIICIILFLGASAFMAYNIYDSRRAIEVPPEAIREERPTEAPTPPPTTAPPTTEAEAEPEPETEPETEPPTEPREILPRVIALREQYNNPDIVGYIEIPGTNVSYPMVQTGNNVFYLYHDLHFQPSRHGSIFVDYENDIYTLADHNMIIYGHNMRDGTKFHNVRHFHRRAYFEDHPYILITTPHEETVWEIFSFFPTTTDFNYLITNFYHQAYHYEFMLYLQQSSIHPRDIEIDFYDQIIILSTCGVHGGENRYILIARLRRDAREDE